VALDEDSRGAGSGASRRRARDTSVGAGRASRGACGRTRTRLDLHADDDACPERARSHASRRACPERARRRASRMARISRTQSRRRCSWRGDRDQLVYLAAGRVVAPPGWSGVVVFRSTRPPPLHAGTARRRRGRRLLQRVDRSGGVDTRRRGPLLRVECRRRSARDANAEQRSCVHAWGDGNPERARCRQRHSRVVAQDNRRQRVECSDLGVLELAAGRRRSRRRCRGRSAARL
jgi:hypothetical protein